MDFSFSVGNRHAEYGFNSFANEGLKFSPTYQELFILCQHKVVLSSESYLHLFYDVRRYATLSVGNGQCQLLRPRVHLIASKLNAACNGCSRVLEAVADALHASLPIPCGLYYSVIAANVSKRQKLEGVEDLVDVKKLVTKQLSSSLNLRSLP